MGKHIKVDNISQYFKAIDDYKLNHYFSRGECIDYKNTKLYASALREFNDNWPTAVEKYRFEVAHQINELQNNYFYAFAQHHKVSTNLLDFSSSPLVSLYFATRWLKDPSEDENGFVYFIPKRKCANINTLFESFNPRYPFIDEVYSWNEKLIEKLVDILQPVFINNSYEYHKSLFSTFAYIINYFEIILNDNEKVNSIKNTIEKAEEDLESVSSSKNMYIPTKYMVEMKLDISEQIILLFKENNEMVNSYIDKYYWCVNNKSLKGVINRDVYIYLIFISLSYYIKLWHMPNQFNDDYDFPFYLIYDVPFIEERVKNQGSLFVYQLWNTSGSFQIIKPEVIIEVSNKQHFQEQLNNIGINDKFIFCDFDHIGKYCNDELKHQSPFIL